MAANLAPSRALIEDATENDWPFERFARHYRHEMNEPEARRLLDLLAAMYKTNFSIGCYCDSDWQCHRWILKELLIEHGALMHGERAPSRAARPAFAAAFAI